MNFTVRQSLNLIQTITLGLVAPVLTNNNISNISIVGLSLGLCVASWGKSRLGKRDETTAKSNLAFLSGNKAWQLQLMLAPFSLTFMTFFKDSPMAMSCIIASLINFELLRQTEQMEAKKQLHFFELLKHRMSHGNADKFEKINKEVLIDWLNHTSDRAFYFQKLSFDNSTFLEERNGSQYTWWRTIKESIQKGHIRNKDGHLHIALGNHILLDFKDDQYIWKGRPKDYAYCLQFLFAEHFFEEFKKLDFSEILPHRELPIYLEQMSALTFNHALSGTEWYDVMLTQNGQYANTYLEEIELY